MRLFRFYLDPAGAEGNGSTEADATKGTDTKGGSTQVDAAKGYDAALAKHGNDAAAMARTIYADNERIRAENDQLRGKLPGEGAVVLNKADAARWAELGKLGPVDEIKGKLAAGDAAIGRVSAFEREKLVGRAAAAVGFDAEVLGNLAGPDLRIEVKEETRAGKKVHLAEVVVAAKDDKGADVEKRTPLDKYAEATWPKFLPSLKAGSTSAPPRVGGSPGRPAPAHPQRRAADAGGDAQPPERRRSAF